MNKSLNTFLALAFVAMQCFSILHNAEYAFAKHQHSQQDCAVYLHAKNTDHGSDIDTDSNYLFLVDAGEKLTENFYHFSPSTATFSLAHPRAPPRSV